MIPVSWSYAPGPTTYSLGGADNFGTLDLCHEGPLFLLTSKASFNWYYPGPTVSYFIPVNIGTGLLFNSKSWTAIYIIVRLPPLSVYPYT